ncbi:MAG TPA: hypothetical protein VHJ54_02195 [Solirubrobacterales bacterium]|jgi:hypothetical protein|nr:hypothetical protein [Solirubrobacterales bacterium]
MDLSLIGPNRRQQTHVGELRQGRVWMTVADVLGITVGAGVAIVLLLTLFAW